MADGTSERDYWARIYYEDKQETAISPSWGTAQGAWQWVGDNRHDPCQVEVYERTIKSGSYKDKLLNPPDEESQPPNRERVQELVKMLGDTFRLDKPKTHRHTDAGFGPNRDGWLTCPTCVEANAKGLNGELKQKQAQAVLDGE